MVHRGGGRIGVPGRRRLPIGINQTKKNSYNLLWMYCVLYSEGHCIMTLAKQTKKGSFRKVAMY